MKLVAVSGGLSTPSSTRLLADRLTDTVRDELADQGHKADVDVIELRALAVAIANNLVTGFPPPQLAGAIEEGLQARRAGDVETATARLGRAVQLASASGNEGTRRLLEAVVDIDDADRGTVRLKTRVSKEDEMTLDTRSRRTVRLPRSPAGS